MLIFKGGPHLRPEGAQHASPGQRPGFESAIPTSPVGARHDPHAQPFARFMRRHSVAGLSHMYGTETLVSPFQGSEIRWRRTQGVALGWHVMPRWGSEWGARPVTQRPACWIRMEATRRRRLIVSFRRPESPVEHRSDDRNRGRVGRSRKLRGGRFRHALFESRPPGRWRSGRQARISVTTRGLFSGPMKRTLRPWLG